MKNFSIRIKPFPSPAQSGSKSKLSSDSMTKMPNKPCPIPYKEPMCPPEQPVSPMPPQHPYDKGMLAHAYIPWQYYGVVYSNKEALDKGTLFPELYMPYHGGDKYVC